MTRLWFILGLIGLAACDGIPADPKGTLDRVRAERQFRVGLIAAEPSDPRWPELTAQLLSGVAGATGARPLIRRDAAEPLLSALERGDLDLVVGPFAPASPWGKHVSLLPPLDERVSHNDHLLLAPAARNGENAWIDLLHRQAQAVRTAR